MRRHGSHVSMPMNRDTMLATEVQLVSSFGPIEAVLRLCFTVNEKNQRRYTQQATIGSSQKVGAACFTDTNLGTKISVCKLFHIFFYSRELCSTSLSLIFLNQSLYND